MALARGKAGDRVRPGEMFGRYRLLGKLATGGMAEVFAAELLAPGGFCKAMVIKRVLPHLAENPRVLEMFMEEARVAARLSHVNICSVFELGDVDGEFYIAMEYLRGVPLTALSRTAGPLPMRVAVGILAQACEGLHYAHEQRDGEGQLLGLVHRDVSPHNLLLTADGVLKVLDFGIAKVGDSSRENTEFGKVKGKLPYMSPEQLAGQTLDRRSDVWALGVVLWELLAGRRLFRAVGPAATVDAIRHGDVPELASVGVLGAEALDAVLGRALCRSREWRYSTAMDLKRAMVDALHQVSPARNEELARLVDAQCGDVVRKNDRLFSNQEPDDDGVVDRLPLRAEPTRSRDFSVAGLEADPGSDFDELGTDSMEQDAPTVPTVEIFGSGGTRGAAYTEPDVEPAPDVEPEPAVEPPARRSQGLRLLFIALAAAGGVAAAVLTRGWNADDQPPAASDSRGAELAVSPGPTAAVDPAATAGEDRAAAAAEEQARAKARAKAEAEATAEAEAKAEAEAEAKAEAEAEAKAEAEAAQAAANAKAEADARATADVAAKAEAEAKAKAAQAHKTARRAKSRSRRTVRREPAAAAPAEPGRMTIDAKPWATIYIDGKKVGTTPLVGIEVPAGQHTIKAVTHDGQSKTTRVDVAPGGELRRRFHW